MKETESIFMLVHQVIFEWNPYNLLSGNNSSECDSEIRSIIRQIDRIHSQTDATHVLSRVFSASFDAHLFSLDSCRDAGEKLFNILKSKNLL